jgi:predicted nucleic acid-binding protein
MSAKFFLDTNIFIYSLGGTPAGKARRAAELVREAIASRNGIISYQVVQEFFSVAFRRFAPPMTAVQAEQYLASVFHPMLAVQSSSALLADALRLYERHRLSWYDSLIIAAALEAQCGVLYSEDMRHGQTFGDLRIENPFR